jgi:hypothetical protein
VREDTQVSRCLNRAAHRFSVAVVSPITQQWSKAVLGSNFHWQSSEVGTTFYVDSPNLNQSKHRRRQYERSLFLKLFDLLTLISGHEPGPEVEDLAAA